MTDLVQISVHVLEKNIVNELCILSNVCQFQSVHKMCSKVGERTVTDNVRTYMVSSF